MNTVKIVEKEGLGIIEYIKSHRAKHVSIRVKKDGQIVVAMPYGVSVEKAEEFVRSKEEWIRKALNKTLQTKEIKAAGQTVFKPGNEFRTKFREMKLLPENRKNLRLKILDSCFEIYYPQDIDFDSEDIQAVIRHLIEHVWKFEAHEYLPEKISAIAKSYNMKYKSLVIKNTVSLWGRCSSDNAILLSLHLMHLPEHLIDYVIMHELCHTVHKDHQKGFWKLLDSMTGGNAKNLDKEMQNYSTRVY